MWSALWQSPGLDGLVGQGMTVSKVDQIPAFLQVLKDPWDARSGKDMGCPHSDTFAGCVFQG